jgi:hypothetical protein
LIMVYCVVAEIGIIRQPPHTRPAHRFTHSFLPGF